MKGLLFTPEMARAVIAGRKTQTRRVVPGKIKPCRIGDDVYYALLAKSASPHPRSLPSDWCQYQPGETVCMLTTWAVAKQFDHLKPTKLSPRIAPVLFWHAGSGSPKPGWAGKSRPGRFLPNKLRHLMPALKIVDVDVQRVRHISGADAVAEGVPADYFVEFAGGGSAIVTSPSMAPEVGFTFTPGGKTTKVEPRARENFRVLWNSINAARGYSWQKNPQVFVIKFEEVLPF